ncbi:MAG: tetratricopeptide repeat protein [Bacteroidales bacterium]
MKVLKDTISTSDDYFIEAMKYYNLDSIKTATSFFKKSIDLDENNDAAYYYLGIIYSTEKNIDKSIKYINKAISIDSTNTWYQRSLAQIYLSNNDVDKSLSIYQNLIKYEPNNVDYYLSILNTYIVYKKDLSNEDINQALKALDRIETLQGANERTGNTRYNLLVKQGKNTEAQNFLEEFEKDHPFALFEYRLGDIYKARYDSERALGYYKKALDLDSTFQFVYLGMGEIYRMKKDYNTYFKYLNMAMSSKYIDPQAKNSYLKGIILKPNYIQNYKMKVDSLLINTAYTNPNDSALTSTAGSYFIQTNNLDAGKDIFKNYMENNIKDEKASMQYIYLLYYLQDWDLLSKEANKTIKLFPKSYAFRELEAIAYLKTKKEDKAIEIYHQALKDFSDVDSIKVACYTSLGDTYYNKGMSQKAYYYYNQVLKLDPENCPTLNNYAYFLSQEHKKLNKAHKMSQITIQKEPDNPTYLDTYAWILYLQKNYYEAKKYFKHAMLYGGEKSATTIDHYADVLYALKEYDLAFIYWERAKKMDPSLDIDKKIAQKKLEMKNLK